MGGAQPLAATMAGASMLAVECQPSRIEMRLRTGYLDRAGGGRWTRPWRSSRPQNRPAIRSRSGLLGNAADVFPELVRAQAGVRPDIVTDQTSAHDPAPRLPAPGLGPRPNGKPRRERDPDAVERRAARTSMAGPRARDAGLPPHGRADGRLRQQHPPDGAGRRAWPTRSTFPGFVPAYIRPLFCRGIGPFRWAALSGNPEDIYATDAKVKELLPDNKPLHRWLDMARERIQLPRLARPHLLGRASATGTASAWRSTTMVASASSTPPS